MKNSRIRILMGATILCLLLLTQNGIVHGAEESLDEMSARKSRQGSAAWGRQYLEDSNRIYTWQPETLSYYDVITGKEAWVLVRQPDQQDIISKEHGSNCWSNDGSRVGFFDMSTRDTGNSALSSGNDRSSRRWIVNADGSGLRASEGYGKYSIPFADFGWAHTETAFYAFGSHALLDGPLYDLYKNVPNQGNQVTGSMIADTSGINSYLKDPAKDGVSGNDKWIVARDYTQRLTGSPNAINTTEMYFIGLDGSPAVDYHWGIARNCGPTGDPYGNHQNGLEASFHDLWSPGPNPQWIMGEYSGTGVFWSFKRSGTASDGGPKWENWDGDSFGVNEEIKCVSNGAGIPNNPYGLPYFGHPVFDRWGKYGLVGTYTDNPKPGTRIWDTSTNSLLGNWVLAYNKYDGQHHSWTGWTDYVVGVDPVDFTIYVNKYNSDYTNALQIASTHSVYSGNYNGYPRPSQSPDGTKIAFAACWLNNSGDDYPYISWAVAYNPYPPEITQASASAGTVSVRFDWRLDQASPRGYTTRKWPDESAGIPPAPREVKQFRLWRSPDGTTWTPLSTVNHDIFTRFDFANGGFKAGQQTYWEISDAPGDGTWYYAVTSVEWSGLESRVLSNVWRVVLAGGAITNGGGAGQQSVVYPASPGAKTSFYTKRPTGSTATYAHKQAPASAAGQYTITWNKVNDSMIRYYNIYAKDGYTPTVEQKCRIASVPASAFSGASCSWIDCFGNPDGSTKYLITSIDYQGNESGTMPAPQNTRIKAIKTP